MAYPTYGESVLLYLGGGEGTATISIISGEGAVNEWSEWIDDGTPGVWETASRAVSLDSYIQVRQSTPLDGSTYTLKLRVAGGENSGVWCFDTAVSPCLDAILNAWLDTYTDTFPVTVDSPSGISLSEFFDPNSEPSGVDPYWGSVVLLLHFDGADGSTTITDSSQAGTVVTVNSDAQIDTAQSKFGGSSLSVNGTYDALYFPGLFVPLTNDWTVEFWYRSAGTPETTEARIFQTTDGDLQTAISLVQTSSNTVRLRIDNNLTAGWAYTSASITITPNVWQHYVVQRRFTLITSLWIDGVNKAQATTNLYDASSSTWVFGGQTTGTSRSVIGHFDEIRITSGVGRYTTGFTVPSAAFPEVGADPKPVSIIGCPTSGCEYKVDDGAWTSAPGEMDVYNQLLFARMTLPEYYNDFSFLNTPQGVVMQLDVGGIPVCYSVDIYDTEGAA